VEKKLVKSAIYGFVFGIAISILVVPDKIYSHQGTSQMTIDVDKWDYIMSILRYSIKASLTVFTVVAIWQLGKRIVKKSVSEMTAEIPNDSDRE